MGAIFSLLFVLVFASFVIRTAVAALTLTGVSNDLARLQAISAFTGVGFTTGESESMVNHPFRRRVMMVLMIVGNVGIVTAVSSLVLTFSGTDDSEEVLERLLYLTSGLLLFTALLFNRFAKVHLHRMLRKMLRRSSRIIVKDYVDLLQLHAEFAITELVIHDEHWLADRRLSESGLSKEGVTVLGIQCADKSYVGSPRGETSIKVGDRLIVYGKGSSLDSLGERRRDAAGDAEHIEAVDELRHERAELAWEEHRRRREGEETVVDEVEDAEQESGGSPRDELTE